jgi:penicillin amidase
MAKSLGSNNWAISPQKTSTGRAILASDPHRVNTLPSGRYITHLQAPGLNVIGAGEPFIPGVSIGHNENIAFGFTIFSADQEDLYQYNTSAGDMDQYQYAGGLKKVETIVEMIPVKGEQPVEVELKYTRHGPIIYTDNINSTLYAVQASWLQSGMAPYLASLGYQKAKNWSQYKSALRRFANPTENHVYADIKGNIGLKSAGRVPFRSNWDGLLPVPGNGDYEWWGNIPTLLLPGTYNPNKGWVASANQMNLPENYLFHVGYEWAAPYRYQRIAEVLSASDSHSVQSSKALQLDYLSIPARELLDLLSPDLFSDLKVITYITQLKQWDKKLTPDSVDAAFFERWWARFLRPGVSLQLVSETAFPYIANLSSFGDQEVILSIIKNALNEKGLICKAAMVQIISESILATDNFLEKYHLKGLSWGLLHSASYTHPISPLMPESIKSQLDIGPAMFRGGSMDTVNSNWHAVNLTGNFETIAGSTWRMVVDVGNWDATLVANAPGQSGDPANEFYQNLFPVWANDQSFPLVFSDQAVSENTVETITLSPK